VSTDDDRRLRTWLDARDPGDAPASLRDAATRVPYDTRQPTFATLDTAITRVFGTARWVRPVLVLVVVLAVVAAAVGAALVQPWRPFPPRGWIAYATPLAAVGSTGITLVAADGSASRMVSPAQANLFDHSPRWSKDGKTLLFARTSNLDPLASCGGVGSVVLYDVASGTERIVATGLRPMNVIDWSPTGDRAAYVYPPPGCGAEVELGVVDLATGSVTTKAILPVQSEAAPAGGIKWHVLWTGDEATAVPDGIVTTTNGRDFTTTRDVPSHDGRSHATSAATSPGFAPELHVGDVTTGVSVDLGPGGVPSWSPDDTAIAFVQPGGPAGPSAVDFVRDHLTIVSVGTWKTRVLADLLVPDGPPVDLLPRVSWTSDAAAIYWTDQDGLHVIDVVTGRSADLAAIPGYCTDLDWQPVP
jgi:dipeptidyl aminopeptidase/acylaminoacyl peptidase